MIFKVFVKKARAHHPTHPTYSPFHACIARVFWPLTCCHAHSCLMNWSCSLASILSSASTRRSLRPRSRLLQKSCKSARTLAETFSCKRTYVRGKNVAHVCACVCLCLCVCVCLCVFVCVAAPCYFQLGTNLRTVVAVRGYGCLYKEHNVTQYT
jgi:hypothetical protein